MTRFSAFKSACLTGSAHLSRIAVGFLLIKVVAFYLGPDGLGALGHFMSLASIIYMVAGGGVTNAVIKYASEYNQQPHRLVRMISAASSYSLACCVVVGLLGVLFSRPLASFLFSDSDSWWLVVLLAAAQFLYAYVNIIVGVGNGLLVTHVYSRIQVTGSLLAAALTLGLVMKYGFNGAAVATVGIYLAPALPAAYFHFRSSLRHKVRFVRLKYVEIKRFARFSGMMLVSAASFPIVEMIVRQALISGAGFQEAGLWQGLIKLSSAYLGFFTIFLSYYFMPMISRERDNAVIRNLTLRMMLAVSLLFVLGAGVLYSERSFFISHLLSDEFSRAADFVGYQLIGDGFRIASYVIGFIAVAKASVRLYVGAELLQNGLFLALAYVLTSGSSGVLPVVQAYALAYVIYFLVAVAGFALYLKKSFGGKSNVVSC